MSQALRFRKVCPLPSQFLRQQFLLRDVHRGADEALEDALFNDGNRHRAKIAQLSVGPNNPLDLVEATVFLQHEFDGFSDGSAVLRMYETQVLLDRRGPVFRIQTADSVQFVRPIVTGIVEGPASYMSETLTFAEVKLAPPQGFFR